MKESLIKSMMTTMDKIGGERQVLKNRDASLGCELGNNKNNFVKGDKSQKSPVKPKTGNSS